MATLVLLAAATALVSGSAMADDHAMLSRALSGVSGTYGTSETGRRGHQASVRLPIMSWGGETCESRFRVGGLSAAQTGIVDWRRVERIRPDEATGTLTLTGRAGGISVLGVAAVEELPLILAPGVAEPVLRVMERIQAACRPSS
ncbi:MAG: hypothetical protein GC145_03220 [Caulobacter sp.]|nr:hypothetical protein [Caulobacter sp.]